MMSGKISEETEREDFESFMIVKIRSRDVNTATMSDTQILDLFLRWDKSTNQYRCQSSQWIWEGWMARAQLNTNLFV